MHDASGWPLPSMVSYSMVGVDTDVTTLLQRAMESDELVGDPLRMESSEKEIHQRPGCRNDQDFGFVNHTDTI